MPLTTNKKSSGWKSRLLISLGLIILVMSLTLPDCEERRDKKGVIVVLLDALRRDHLSYYGYNRPTSPFLDSLIKKGVMFKNAIAAAPQTVPSVSSLLTGLYPYRHGSHFFSGLQSYHPVKPVASGGLPLMKDENLLLTEIFSESGYRTALLSSNPGIRNIYGFSQGAGYFRYKNCFSEEGAGVCNGASLNRIFEKDVLPKIKGENFFVYLHYMDVHNPYHKPNSFKGRFIKYQGEPVYVNGKPHSMTGEQLEYSKACYDEGIIYLDEVLKELFGILEREGLAADTMVVIAPDHGDEFYEHGGLGHGTTCYNELIQSFILFVNPSLHPRVIESPVSLVDVFPTVLEWAGLTTETEIDGYSLMSYLNDGKSGAKMPEKRILISELGDRKAIIDSRWKFIYNMDSNSIELYDIKKDPAEMNNIAENRKDLTKRYFEIIKKIIKKMAVSYSVRTLSEDELKNLRSLGYIQ